MRSNGLTRVFAVRDVDLRVVDGTWDFADGHRTEIDEHWARRAAEAPGFFNGIVHLLTHHAVSSDGVLSARYIRTDFKSFLYLRETGWRDSGVADSFGSALIFSSDGHLLLGRQRHGNLNAGLCYPPSGFIDADDVAADGVIDISHSAQREIVEETGLDPGFLRRVDGYIVTLVGPVVCIGVPWRAPWSGETLLQVATRYIEKDPNSELAGVLLAQPGTDAGHLPMPDYARAMIRELPRLITGA
jgi:8-oxo-dGTP pyrophosphatase MutT (NUDIX family)